MDDPTLERFADLVVGFGANVQQDQIVAIRCEPGQEYLTRALAASAYRHGAKFVDVSWFDPHVKRARIEYARAATLDFVPSWYGERVLALKEGIQVVNDRTTNWTICPCPTQVWADLVHPGLDERDRLERLERELLHV